MKKSRLYILLFILLAGMLLPSGTAEAASRKIKLNKTSVTLVKGKSATIKLVNAPKLAKMSKKDKKNLKWTTSNAKVVKITSKNKSVKQVTVEALKAGTATIKAKYKGKTYKCKVTVKKTNSRKPESTTENASGKEETTETPATKKAVPVPDQPTNEVQTVYTGEELVLSAHLSDGDKSAYTKYYGISLMLDCSIADTSILKEKGISSDDGKCKKYFKGLKPGTTTVTAKDKVSGLTFTWTVKVVDDEKNPYKQRYTYKSYVLAQGCKFKSPYWDASSGTIFSNAQSADSYVYIRTDNPGDGVRKMYFVYKGMENSSLEITKDLFAQVQPYFSKGVTGGYIIPVSGERNLGDWYIREYAEDGIHSYDTPLCEVKEKDVTTEYDKWLDAILVKSGITDSMTVPEKVEALANYIRTNMYYSYRAKTLEENMKTSFMVNQCDSLACTMYVYDLAKKLGITVRSMYGEYDRYSDYELWLEWHSQVELVYNGQTYHYKCCPYKKYNTEAVYEDFDLTPYQ